jgi:competence protein ComEA
MQLIETETGRREPAGKRSPGSTSPARRGAGVSPAASRSFAARLRGLRQSVWLPLMAKALGLLAGMLALAAIGASSLAKGSGVRVAAPAQPGVGVATAALAATSHAATPHAPERPANAPPTTERSASDAGAEPSDAGAEPSDAGAEPGDAGAPPAALTPDGKVILNLAGISELRRLPGIGAKRAEAILALRAKLGGRFKRLTDLLRVKGIGTKGLKKIEANAVLDAPKA